MIEKNPSSANVRAYPKDKQTIRQLRLGTEREPDTIRRILQAYMELQKWEKEHANGAKR